MGDLFVVAAVLGLFAFCVMHPRIGLPVFFVIFFANFTYSFVHMDSKNIAVMDSVMAMNIREIRNMKFEVNSNGIYNILCIDHSKFEAECGGPHNICGLHETAGRKCFDRNDGYLPLQVALYFIEQ